MFWLGVSVYVIEYMYKRTRKQQDIYKIMYVCMYVQIWPGDHNYHSHK